MTIMTKQMLLMVGAVAVLGALSPAGHAQNEMTFNRLSGVTVATPTPMLNPVARWSLKTPTLDRLAPGEPGPDKDQPPAYKPVRVEEDLTRKILMDRFAQAGAATADTSLAERALKETLGQGRPDLKVQIGPMMCRANGCLVDVEYPSPDAFRQFEEGKYGRPDLPFDKWPGTSGRTGLLVDGGRLIATWYFVLPPKS